MPKLTSVRDLLIDQVKDLYSAETQLTAALPKMAEAASAPDLKEAFEKHLTETEGHVARIEEIMSKLGGTPDGKKCLAMAGLIAEGAEVIEEDATPEIKDLALIASAQKVEHYEIAGYGCARTLAELLGEDEIAETLQLTLDEEGDTDAALTTIASEMDLSDVDGDDDDDDDAEKPTAAAVAKAAAKSGKLRS